MPCFYLSSLICLSFFIPVSAGATSSIKDAEAVITMRNGCPCFSYPQDNEIRKRPYSFDDLAVSINGPNGGVAWEIGIEAYDRKGMLEPGSTETCIKYGAVNPGMKEKKMAKALLADTPYRVRIHLSEAPGTRPHYVRMYASDFCLSSNEQGEPVLVGANWNDTDGWNCLKPGKSPKRGFWQRLFGE